MSTSSADAVPNPHATAEQVAAARRDSKLAQVLYHDWEAESYDDKWSISYDQRCIDYARGRFDAIVPDEPAPEASQDGHGAVLLRRPHYSAAASRMRTCSWAWSQ
jgi:hypothetical protein